MTKFTKEFSTTTSSRKLLPDEYFNETDNLIYCSKCNAPRQRRYELQGKFLIPSIHCKCQQEIFEQEEAKRKLYEKQMEIEHLKTSGLQDKALYDYTFDKDSGINLEMTLAHNYVANWEEMKAKSSGLLLWGDVGTGKSFFAGCIANALLEKGIPVLMTNFSRILNTLTGMHFEDRNQFIDSLNRYSLLIIDDLGIERNSEFALEQVFNVIDSRYRSKKPLIVTTNLTFSENAIRPFTVGRKNWLFCDTPNEAQASAIVYTMVEMVKTNGVNVYHYLTYLLEKLPNDGMNDDELELLASWNENLKAEIERRANESD